jgi:maleate cis-trans isomerase
MSFTLWRGVTGLIKPTRRPGTLEELIRMLPEGIGVVPLLLNFKAGTEDEFRKSIPDYEQYVCELSEQKVDMTIISGTPPFMLLGYDAEARLIDEWSRQYAMPIVTDSQMQAAGLHAMGIKKFIGASYSPLQNQISINYMKQAGLTAVAMEPIDVPFDQVAQISVEQLYVHVKKLFLTDKGADGIYIQGGGWQTTGVVAMLEQDLQVPVVHATVCQAWQIHRLLRVRGTKPGYGRLLAELP